MGYGVSKYCLAVALSAVAATVQAQTNGNAASALSEQDYLGEMPVVLSVSRLAQRLDEAPGAVTIIDRDFIRMSGARDLVDVLRLVPGFQTTLSFETDAPMASYHGRSDDFSNRIQVMVDGRAVYSSSLQGSTGVGLQTLPLDDIERVEILRGSNSAAYGSRAFLGVINIISRDVRDTQGVAVSVTNGENQIQDRNFQVGWGDESATYRIHADTRGDAGLRGAFGANRIERANFSGRIQLDGGSDVSVRAGGLNIDAGRGSLLPDEYGNPARLRYLGSRYAQLDWRTSLNESRDVLVSVSHSEYTTRDKFPFLDPSPSMSGYYGIPIDFGVTESQDAITVQDTMRVSDSLRVVSGFELRQEQVVSPSSFEGRGGVLTNFARLFSNVEWRMSPQWVANFGGLAENSDIAGNSFSPRVMFNWHFVPGHTLRAGVSTAFRPPSPYEKYAVVRYYDLSGANPISTVQNAGLVGPEHLEVRELGYHASLPQFDSDLDARLFDERISDGIGQSGDAPVGIPYVSMNGDSSRIHGFEWQLTYGRSTGTRAMLTQTWTQIDATTRIAPDFDFRIRHGAPRYSASLALMHRFSNGVEAGLTYSRVDDVALMSIGTRPWLYSWDRVDLRIAKTYQLGHGRATVSLVGQNLGGPMPEGDRQYTMDPRVFVTVKMEF